MEKDEKVAIIGAGPAGLTAAYELAKHGITGTVLEADSIVGGIARTVVRGGYRFDVGPHRFFTKSKEINDLWDEMAAEPLLVCPRLTRILYRGKFYDYPLKVSNALRNMGILRALSCLASYGMARLRPIRNPRSFEEWTINQFGSKLYSMFFRTYTEKVWGIPCTEIGADWAAQRIKGLNLGEAVKNALFGSRKSRIVKTLIEEFRYPRLGAGYLWQSCADKVVEKGWQIALGSRVRAVNLEDGRVASIIIRRQDGDFEISCNYLLSSMPIRDLILGISPSPPDHIVQAARGLAYRAVILVILILEADSIFPDNWIYVHSPEVKMGRIQNFKNWSADMVPEPTRTSLGLEYYVNEGDELWQAPDDVLIQMGYSELDRLGLAAGSLVEGYVIRMPKAYPVYDKGFAERIAALKEWLSSIGGLYCIGRNGQHRYNNQDHSMMTALIAARNIALGQSGDPWAVNEDAEYHEIDRREEH